MAALAVHPRMLSTLVNQAATDKFSVPDMQRDFRWGRERIRSLLASVIAGHPIGAVTVIKRLDAGTGGRIAPGYSLMSRLGLEPDSKTVHILDGQQRLVALLAGFRGPRTAEGLKGRDTDWFESRVGVFGWRIDLLAWAASLRDGDTQDVSSIERAIKASYRWRRRRDGRSESLADESRRLMALAQPRKRTGLPRAFELPLWYLLRQGDNSRRLKEEYGSFIKEFRLKARDMRPEIVEGHPEAIIERLAAVMAYQIPFVEVDACQPIRAAQMFRRMNQQGLPLSVSDLVCSQLFAHDPTLRRDMRGYQAQCDKRSELSPLAGIFEQDILLASVCAGHSGSAGIDLHGDRLLARVDRHDGVEAIRAGFDRLNGTSSLCATILRSCGVASRGRWPIDAISIAMIAAVAVHRSQFEKRETEGVLKRQLRRWWWSEHLRQVMSMRRRPGLVDVFVRLCEFLNDPAPARPAPCSFGEAGLHEALRAPRASGEASSSQSLTALVECLLRAGKPHLEDLFSGEELGPESEGVDLHHIFPKAWARRLGAGELNVDSVVNLTLMESNSNRNIIRDTSPGQLFAALLAHGRSRDPGLTPEAVRATLESHGLQVDAFLAGDYEVCCEHRLSWIDDRLRALLA